MRRRAITVAVLAATACAGGDDARRATLLGTLITSDEALIAARPARVAGKYAAMIATPQTFLRGTAPVFFRDLSAPLGTMAVPHGADAELVGLYGDLHLENAGATFDADGVLFDCIDFDSALEGPFAWDVLRTALALETALAMAGRDDAVRAAALHALADGYLAALPRAPETLRSGLGRVVTATLADGAARNAAREQLTKYTTLDAGGARSLVRDSELVAPPPPWDSAIPAALAGYLPTRRGGVGDGPLVVHDVIEKLQSGIASFANLRFWALVSLGSEQDLILELKEERDPPQPVAALGRGAVGDDNAARVLAETSRLLSTPSTEPDLGHLVVAGVPFQIRSVLRGRRDLDVLGLVDSFATGDYGDADAVALGGDLGHLLANGHVRGGGDAGAILAAAGVDFGDRVAAFARDYHAQLLVDLDLFKRALVERGPLLGAR